MQPQNPAPLTDPLYSQALKSWYSSLRDHDVNDLRGHVEGLVCVLGLIASRLPDGPRASFTSDDAFELKVKLWRSALQDLLGCSNGEKR